MVKKTWWETSHWWTAASQQYCHCVSIFDVRILKQRCLHKASSSQLLHGRDRAAMLGKKPTVRDVQKMELLFLRLEKLKGLAGLELPVPVQLYLGVEGSCCTVQQGLPVAELHRLGHVGQHLDTFIQSLLEWLRNDGGVNSWAEQEKCLLDTSHFQTYLFFLFFFIISFHFKTQDTQVRINWRHFSRMFFTSVWPPLLFSAVKTERKSFNIPSDLSYQTSPASFPAIPDIPEILSPSSLGILKAAAVQLMPVRRLTMVKFQAFKNCFPIVLYETPQFPWSVGYTLYPSNWLTATSSFIPHMQEDKKTSVPTISAW